MKYSNDGLLQGYSSIKKVFKNDWFSTGDLGVIHKNGYMELKDRLKDIIISGGENISSVEIKCNFQNERC